MTLSYRMEFEMLWIFTSRIFFTESTLFFVKTLILGLREVIYYIYFECNKKNGEVWVDNKTIRSFLKEVFSFNNEQIKQVMKEWLGEHYKLDVKKIIWSANTVHQYVARTLQNK